jgi:anti-sigma factor RsiW
MTIAAYIPGTYAWKRRREGVLCMKTHERIQEIVDGELRGSRAERVLERHLEACTSCDADAQVIRDLKQAISRVASTADAEMVQRLEDLARQLCEQHRPPPE